jgi:uncharacterized membrane protein
MAAQINTDTAELSNHAANYHSFMLTLKWFGIHLAALMAFLMLWFCTSAGFFAGLFAGVVILAAGIFAMRHGGAHSSADETVAIRG